MKLDIFVSNVIASLAVALTLAYLQRHSPELRALMSPQPQK